MSYSGSAPLMGDQDHYRGERVVQRAEIDVNDVADKLSSQRWCQMICFGVAFPFCCPLFSVSISPCGAEDRVRLQHIISRHSLPQIRRKLNGTRLILTYALVLA